MDSIVISKGLANEILPLTRVGVEVAVAEISDAEVVPHVDVEDTHWLTVHE